MLTGGSFFYIKKVRADEASWNVESTGEGDLLSEQSKIQKEILAGQAEEARLRADLDLPSTEVVGKEDIIDTSLSNPVATKQPTNNTFANNIAEKQAEYQASQQALLEAQHAELKKKQIEADVLVQQIADQKATDAYAQQRADQRVASQKAVTQRASRRSRAS